MINNNYFLQLAISRVPLVLKQILRATVVMLPTFASLTIRARIKALVLLVAATIMTTPAIVEMDFLDETVKWVIL